MPTLYGVNASPFVRKVRVVMEEKGLAYELEPVIPINVSAEFKKLSPLGKIPAYRDGDLVLSDSSVICAYLEKIKPEPAIYPSDPGEYAKALWFEEYGDTAVAEVLTAKLFREKVVAQLLSNRPTDEAVVEEALRQDLPPLFDYLEGQIGSRDSLVGDWFSIGDVGVATHFVNFSHAGFEVDSSRWPRLARYIKGVLGRPSFKKLIEEEAKTYSLPK